MRTVLLLLSIAVGVLAGPPAHAKTLKIATIVPEGSGWMREMRAAADEIAERTEGRVKLKFYPGGVMGGDQTVLRKMRLGQLHGGAFPSGAFSQVFPDLDLYGLPLLFRSYDEVDYVRARMDAGMIEGIERAGYVVLGISDTGFAYLMSQEPVRRVGDLSGTKVWIQEGDKMSQTAFETAGVSPVQLPLADVYTALQTGLIDTLASPPIGTIAFQWHTRVRYLTDVPLMYLIGLLVLDGKAFAKLAEGDQQIVREAVGTATRKLDAANRKAEGEAREALRAQGIEFVAAASPEELVRWHEITDQALAILRSDGDYSDMAIDTLHRHLEEFRRTREARAH